jgi:REP element-mobilizing transposase RayT
MHDSLPGDVWERLRSEHARTAEDDGTPLFERADRALDESHGSCLLRQPRAASAVVEYLIAKSGVAYDLEAFVVMPNHVHVLVTARPNVHVGDMARILKGGSSFAVNKALGRTGNLWQRDYFDRVIRDSDHFRRTLEYIEWNPVRARLAATPESFPWSSAHPRVALRLSSTRETSAACHEEPSPSQAEACTDPEAH